MCTLEAVEAREVALLALTLNLDATASGSTKATGQSEKGASKSYAMVTVGSCVLGPACGDAAAGAKGGRGKQ